MLLRSLYASAKASALTWSIASGASCSMRSRAADDQRDVGGREVLRVDAGLVEVFDQILPVVRGDVGVVDGGGPDLLGGGVRADQAQRLTRDRNRNDDVGVIGRVDFPGGRLRLRSLRRRGDGSL
jgi:hypothetical protein